MVVSEAAPAVGDALTALLAQVWPATVTGELVASTGDVPPGYVALDRFRVLPDASRALFMLPESPRVAAAALICYNALRQPRTRAYRRLLGTALRAGAGELIARQRLSVCTRSSATRAAAELSLTHHVQKRLGSGPLSVAIGLTNPGPNRKPILQMFDQRGAPIAFVKVGWNDVTKDMVDNEAAALASLTVDGTTHLSRPTVLLYERWQGLTILATRPLPLDVVGYPQAADPPQALSEVLPSASAVETHPALVPSEYWRSVRERSDAVVAAGTMSGDEVTVLRRTVEDVEASAPANIACGPWHGDWSFWNLACAGRDLWAWDWEHYAPSVPVGFDPVHFVFQREFVHRRRSVADALEAVARNASLTTGRGQHPAAHRLVTATLYPLEMYLRAASLFTRNAGWNPRFRDGVLRWLSSAR